MRKKIAIRWSLLFFSLMVSAGVNSQNTENTGKAEGGSIATVTGTVYAYTNRLSGIEVSVSSEVSGGLITTHTNERGEYSIAIPYLLSAEGSASLKFQAMDPDGKYRSMEFGAILYPDKTDGYDFHMNPL